MLAKTQNFLQFYQKNKVSVVLDYSFRAGKFSPAVFDPFSTQTRHRANSLGGAQRCEGEKSQAAAAVFSTLS
jgi:hypothetical protein